MGRKTEKEEKRSPTVDHEAEEKKRLRSLAVSKKILRRSRAIASATLEPSMAVVKLHGRDIVKRGQRKSRYLFSFPGLIAPLSGGKIGELANLATKNPVLYLEFPEGRMKLFGTHVYPKNKYLTLQITKSAKGVMCEDVFESLIVFSEARWIGRKEENPEEYELEYPKDLKEGKTSDYDFKGGAGAAFEDASGGQKRLKDYLEHQSPANELDYEDSADIVTDIRKDEKQIIEKTPLRQSTRTSGKTVKKVSYAESSSSEDSIASSTEAIKVNKLGVDVEGETKAKSPACIDIDDSGVASSSFCSPEDEAHATKESMSGKPKQTLQYTSRKSPIKKGTLVQANLSTLFEKVADKKAERTVEGSPGTKSPGGKRQRLLSKEKTEPIQVKGLNRKGKQSSAKCVTGSVTATKRKKAQEDDDWSEDISSDSQNDDGDEDWVA